MTVTQASLTLTVMTFNLPLEIAKANAEQLDRLNVWDSQAMTIPAFLLKANIGQFVFTKVPDLTRKP